MKKIVLSLAVVFVMLSFTTANKNVENISLIEYGMILTSCGEYYEYAIEEPLTDDQLFDIAEAADTLVCG